LALVFAAAGVVFEAGATTFFSLFDVVITSFSVVFRSLWFLPHIHVLGVPGYTLCPSAGILMILNEVFCGLWTGNAPGNLRTRTWTTKG
jgi:hypothetical protein